MLCLDPTQPRLAGAISVMETLNYEHTRQYLLTVRATDGGHPPLSTDVAVNVTLTDVNDNSASFVQTVYSALIAEDADVGERLIQVRVLSQLATKHISSAEYVAITIKLDSIQLSYCCQVASSNQSKDKLLFIITKFKKKINMQLMI